MGSEKTFSNMRHFYIKLNFKKVIKSCFIYIGTVNRISQDHIQVSHVFYLVIVQQGLNSSALDGVCIYNHAIVFTTPYHFKICCIEFSSCEKFVLKLLIPIYEYQYCYDNHWETFIFYVLLMKMISITSIYYYFC